MTPVTRLKNGSLRFRHIKSNKKQHIHFNFFTYRWDVIHIRNSISVSRFSHVAYKPTAGKSACWGCNICLGVQWPSGLFKWRRQSNHLLTILLKVADRQVLRVEQPAIKQKKAMIHLGIRTLVTQWAHNVKMTSYHGASTSFWCCVPAG